MAWTAPKTWAPGADITASDLNVHLRDNLTAIGGAWRTDWTPTLAQGVSTNIAKTVTYARYLRIGGLVIGQVMVAATGTGTAGSKVTISLPVAAASSSGPPVGSGIILDNGTSWYPAVAWLASTTTLALQRADAPSGNKEGFGFDPNVAVAAGDQFNASFMYETSP